MYSWSLDLKTPFKTIAPVQMNSLNEAFNVVQSSEVVSLEVEKMTSRPFSGWRVYKRSAPRTIISLELTTWGSAQADIHHHEIPGKLITLKTQVLRQDVNISEIFFIKLRSVFFNRNYTVKFIQMRNKPLSIRESSDFLDTKSNDRSDNSDF